MRSFFALQEKQIHQGGWHDVIHWSKDQIQSNTAPIKIFTSRGGEKTAIIIAEITLDGIRKIKNGRHISLKALINGNNI